MKLKCFICGENIKTHGPNAKKVEGRWIHKVCPNEIQRRKDKNNK